MAPPDRDIEVGQAALIARYGLRVPPPAVVSAVGPGARRTSIDGGRTYTKYTLQYRPDDSLVGHLRFALGYEPIDIGILKAAFEAAGPREIESWARAQPTGAYARRAWFLYEWTTGKTLDVPDATGGAKASALEYEMQFTARAKLSHRHKIFDNILGVPGFAPLVRRTARLREFDWKQIKRDADALVAACDPVVLARAVDYLYTKETMSSFAIERETPDQSRARRFVDALKTAQSFDIGDTRALIALQNVIVDSRYAEKGFRDEQNFVGQTVSAIREQVHFVCPRPADVPGLMRGWGAMVARLLDPKSSGTIASPVTAAAAIAFGFVFVHPFMDGNGRIHRFLIHHVLAKMGFAPAGGLFPVSASILRDPAGYDAALESVSKPIMDRLDWRWSDDRTVEVLEGAADLYRYFDATAAAEFLCEKIEDTVRVDLKDELDFIGRFDAVRQAVREVVDMPDRRESLLVRLLMQNGGALSKAKRPDFAELTDPEIAAIETGARAAMDARDPKTPPPA